MKDLAEIIWKEGGFRFRYRATNSSLRFDYHCCQDQAHERELDGPRIRELDDNVEEGEDLISVLQAAVENCSDQKAKGNQKFIQKFAASQASTRKLVEEITSLRNRRSMPQAWASYRHPATMYYR